MDEVHKAQTSAGGRVTSHCGITLWKRTMDQANAESCGSHAGKTREPGRREPAQPEHLQQVGSGVGAEAVDC